MTTQPDCDLSSNEILKSRARELARPLMLEPVAGDSLEVIEFHLAHERYAIEHQYVREVVCVKDLAPLPCVPAFFPGIINLRSQILPLLDIKKFFDLPEKGLNDLHMVLVVAVGDYEIGLLADSIAGVRSIPRTSIQPALPTLTGVRSKYLMGIAREMLVILDVNKIVSDPKLLVNEEVSV